VPGKVFIDSTCIKVRRYAGGGKRVALAHGIGVTKGGGNTKLHAVCYGYGCPLVLMLTPGNVHDCKVAEACLTALPPTAHLVADKGYDSQKLREWLETGGADPPRSNRKVQYAYDKAICRERNATERMFCRLKDWRRSRLQQPSSGGCNESGP
jgi:transposase